MLQDDLFRKKSIDTVSSPEQLDDYIRVVSPGIWLVVAGIALVILGTAIWAVFGTVPVEDPQGVSEVVHPITLIF